MRRVANLVTVVGVLIALPLAAAPVPKELKATRPQFRVVLEGKDKDWGLELLIEWEWGKPDEQGGIKLTKWEGSGPFPAFDAKSLLAKGTPDPKADTPKGSKAVQFAGEKDHLLLVTTRKPLGNTWIVNGGFGFSDQDLMRNGSKTENAGYHVFNAAVALFAGKDKKFVFTVPEEDTGAVTPLGPDTTQVTSGTVQAFMATNSAGETHITIHANFGGVTLNTRPNSVHLPRRDKLTQESPKDAPVNFGNGGKQFPGRWRFEYSDNAK